MSKTGRFNSSMLRRGAFDASIRNHKYLSAGHPNVMLMAWTRVIQVRQFSYGTVGDRL
jgi:hypothetical protein